MTDDAPGPRDELDRLRLALPPHYGSLEIVDRGGMGILVQAIDRRTGDRVAIKTPLPAADGRYPPELTARFVREAEANRRLSHPYIVASREIRAHGDIPYLVMEWIDGPSLDAHLRAITKVPLVPHLRLALDICDAVRHAHRMGVIHRDLKPANILLPSAGGVKLLDFGLARLDDRMTALTRTQQVLGTPSHMAPEQLAGGPVDARTDIYALGVIIYQLITLELPFPAEGFVLKGHRPAPAPSSRNPRVTPTLDRLTLTALAIDPGARQRTVDELMDQLAVSLRGEEETCDLDALALLQCDLAGSPAALDEHPPSPLVEGLVRDVTVLRLLLEMECGDRSRRPDPPTGAARAIRERVLCLLARSVERYGGAVERYEPDGLIGTFGARAARDDDPVRAVTAGLELLLRIGEVNRILAPRGHLFALAVGIDLARLLVKADGALDDLVADPARPPTGTGSVWVSIAVRGMVDRRFAVEPDATAVGGLVRVQGPLERSAAGPVQGAVRGGPFVGRRRELEVVERFYRKTGTDRGRPGPARPALVLVSGAAGIGKSRFIDELCARLSGAGPTLALRGAASSCQELPYGAFGGMLRRWLRLAGSSSKETAGQALQAALPAAFPPGRDAGALAAFVGDIAPVLLVAGRPGRDAVVAGLATLFEHLAGRAALEGARLLVVLEDVQWLDELSWEVADGLLGSALPAFVVASARAPFEVPDRWLRSTEPLTVELGPLSPVEAQQLLGHALGRTGCDEALAGELLAWAGGHPLYLEETAHLIATRPGRPPGVPRTLGALVACRLDHLGDRPRELVQLASVLGLAFPLALLEDAAGRLWGGRVRSVGELVAGLTSGGLLEARDRWLSFVQGAVREAVYDTVPVVNRRILHGVVLATLEEQGQGDPAVLAHHADRCGDRQRALAHALTALEAAVARSEHRETLGLSARALTLLETEAPAGSRPAMTVRVLAAREQALEARGERDEQGRTLVKMLELARELGDRVREADCLNLLSRFSWWHRHDLDRAVRLAREALALARDVAHRVGQADALRNLACTLSLLGRFADAVRRHRGALGLYRQAGHVLKEAASLYALALNLGELGLVGRGLTLARKSLVLYEAQGDRRGQGRALRTLGDLYRSVGMDRRAVACYERALSGDRHIGYSQGQAHSLRCLGASQANLGRPEAAVSTLEAAARTARDVGARSLLAEIELELARALLDRDDPDDRPLVLAYLENAMALGERIGQAVISVEGLALQTRFELARAAPRDALRVSQRALALLGDPAGAGADRARRDLPSGLVEAQARYWRSRALSACGLRSEAAESLAEAVGIVLERSTRIPDGPLRRSFLGKVRLCQLVLPRD
ncbi:MAG: protein kinase [Candidatus Riflebacteria bacterium]|nr:protein kinase [Candidatus Riflebacteria bacterium]